MNFVHLGACVGNWNKTINDYKCGFTNFIKANANKDDQIYLVEANPKNIEKLKENYKNFHNANLINIAISTQKENKIFLYYTEDDAPHYMVSSTKISHVKKYYPNSFIDKFEVEAIDINKFFERFIKNKKIDFLSIDLEGIDYDVLMMIDLKKYNILNISIEHLHLNKFQKRKLISHLSKFGYSYCGFGYDSNNYDYLFKKKKIFINRFLSKFLWVISKKHLHLFNLLILKK